MASETERLVGLPTGGITVTCDRRQKKRAGQRRVRVLLSSLTVVFTVHLPLLPLPD